MTDRDRFGPEWAKEVERRFQEQVLVDTRGAWTRAAIEDLVRQHGLTVRWESDVFCLLSSPDACGGHVALRLGKPITLDDEQAVAWLKNAADANRHIA